MEKDEIASMTGPVEKIDGNLMLIVPLWAGGDQFIECARGISKVEGEYLKITIPAWLAEKIGAKEGSRVTITNAEGKLNIFVEEDEPAEESEPLPRIQ